jgi:predicted MFS family arabinose efflux permease
VRGQAKTGGSSLSGLMGTTFAPLRVRNFRLLFGGQMLSTIGDMFYAVALPWLMLSGGRSPQELGIVLSAYGATRVATVLLGGLLSDRFGPRLVMLLSDAMRALLLGLLVVLVASGEFAVLPLVAVSAPLGAFTGLFLPAYYTILPEVLSQEELPAGNALNTSSYQLAVLVGSAIAGVVVSSLKPVAALAVDAVTFVISSLSLFALRGLYERGGRKPAQGDAELPPSRVQAAGEALRFDASTTFWQLLRQWRLLHVGLVIIVTINLTTWGLFEVALPVLALHQFTAGATGYGLLLAAFGVGALTGGLVAGSVGRRSRRGLIMLAMILALALFYPLVPITGGLAGALLVLALAGGANGLLNVVFFIVVQQLSPPHLLGRVLSVLLLANVSVYPLSVALGGLVTTRFGPMVLFVATGGLLALASLFGYLQPEMRKLQ